jgi:hypothetical protein
MIFSVIVYKKIKLIKLNQDGNNSLSSVDDEGILNKEDSILHDQWLEM